VSRGSLAAGADVVTAEARQTWRGLQPACVLRRVGMELELLLRSGIDFCVQRMGAAPMDSMPLILYREQATSQVRAAGLLQGMQTAMLVQSTQSLVQPCTHRGAAQLYLDATAALLARSSQRDPCSHVAIRTVGNWLCSSVLQILRTRVSGYMPTAASCRLFCEASGH
jgi:hypothetical protein